MSKLTATEARQLFPEMIKLQLIQNEREQAKDFVDYYEGQNHTLPRFRSIDHAALVAERAGLIGRVHSDAAEREAKK